MSLSSYYLDYGRHVALLRRRRRAYMRTRPQAIPLAMTIMRKSTHGFSFASQMGMGLLRTAGTFLGGGGKRDAGGRRDAIVRPPGGIYNSVF